jgi:hypothetical protein
MQVGCCMHAQDLRVHGVVRDLAWHPYSWQARDSCLCVLKCCVSGVRSCSPLAGLCWRIKIMMVVVVMVVMMTAPWRQ